MKFALNLLLMTFTISLFLGCASKNINPQDFQNEEKRLVYIPESCQSIYKLALPRVAVLSFTNNSTYGKIDLSTTTTTKTDRVGFGAGITPFGVFGGAGADSKSIKDSQNRTTDAKLSESVTAMVENLLANHGGVRLISRADLDKINDEMKLQDSGLIDPSTVVEFGKISGAQIIITGSIDNVEQKYINYQGAANAVNQQTSRSRDTGVQLAGMFLKIAADLSEGMIVKSKITIRAIDAQTGKILFSKALDKEVNIGKIMQPSFDQIVGGIKKAIDESLPQMQAEFTQYFSVRGYITKIKHSDGDYLAQINIGKNLKVDQSSQFAVFAFDEIIDPINGSKTCDQIMLPTKLEATEQITATHTWTKVQGNGAGLRLGVLVQKIK